MTTPGRSRAHWFGGIRVRPPVAMANQRIGLLGGSFNPPHEGHLLISRIARQRLQLNQVWWLITPGNPLKSHDELANLGQRIKAAQTMVNAPWLVVTPFETRLRTAYTAATLRYLKLRYPRTHFVWLMGADNLSSFHRWQDWRGIARTIPLAVVNRPNFSLKALSASAAHTLARYRVADAQIRALATRKPPAWAFLTGPLSAISSTEIREKTMQ